MYLTDDDLIDGLKKCAENLTINQNDGSSGLIIIKENVGCYLNKEDNSLIRSPMHFKAIVEAAGLEVIEVSYQPGWPKELFDIYMMILRKKIV